jgi:hypothetical protein
VQLIILLPVIGYGLFAFIIGFLYNYYVIPGILLLYIIGLAALSAGVYVRLVNRLAEAESQSILLKITRKWQKPFFSLFIYHVFDRLKLSYVLTKLFSGVITIAILHFFADVQPDLRVAGMVMLAIIMGHAILIYQEHRFKETYMVFSRNLPYRREKLFLNFIGTYVLLLLPEGIWLFLKFNFPTGLALLLFGLSTALLFRSLLYWFGLNMRRYLKAVGGLFFLFQFIIVSGFLWLLIPLNLAVSFLLFYRYYYRYKPVL